jgi:hypothetical protein
MPVGETTLELWKRAPAWRISLIGAVAATVLAILAGQGAAPTTPTSKSQGQVSVPQPQSQPQPQPQPTSSPVQCGPQGQVTVQAPIVVSSSGRLPSNVKTGTGSTQSGGLSTSVQARFVQFSTRVDAARREPREGERCVKMQGALDGLQASDYAYADCFQKGKDKLVEAQACSSDLANSEKRFERLKAAFEASREDSSADKIEELARAKARMTPFDENRERWNLSDKVRAAGDSAVKAVADSDARILALKQAGDQPRNIRNLKNLAVAAELTALDRARLSERDLTVLERAEEAKEALSASDARLSALQDALTGNPAKNEASREQLIAALSALTELDLSLATASQEAAIDQARSTAGKFAVSDLIKASSSHDPADENPAVYQRLRDLLLAVERYGGQVDRGTPGARAVEIARKAEARIVRSERHISNMHATVERVKQGGPAELGGDVIRVHKALDSFDLARMTEEDKVVYRQLESALEITQATNSQKLTRQVPMFLSVEKSDALTQFALDSIRQGLRNAGFNLVAAAEESAVTLLLRRSEIIHKRVRFSGSEINTAEVTLSVTGEWTFAGKGISVPSASGDAVGSDHASLAREAVKEAADGLIDELKALTDA